MQHQPIGNTIEAPSSRFVGDVYLSMIKQPVEPSRLAAAHVRFAPGARTNWHSHAVGQTLYVVEGVGLVVTRAGEVAKVRAGEAIWCPPGEEHWHGGTADTAMAHIAMVEGTGDGDGTTWLEPVPEEQYRAAHEVG